MTLAGEDLDHPVCRSRSEQRGRRWSLHHFEPLDVSHADHIERTGRDVRTLGRERPRNRAWENVRRESAVHHPDPIHVDERLIGEDHASVAAKPDLLALSRLAARAGDLDTDRGTL